MKNKISKINKLKNLNSYWQINYIKGFKYIDKAGEIVNSFYVKDKEPIFSMERDQLTILLKTNKDKKLEEEIKISTHDFWYHFVQAPSFQYQKDHFLKKFNETVNILKVNEFKRVGIRQIFEHEFDSGDDLNNCLKKYVNSGNFQSVFFAKDKDGVNFNFRIIKNGNQKILMDVDIFKMHAWDEKNIYSGIDLIFKQIDSEFLLNETNNIILCQTK